MKKVSYSYLRQIGLISDEVNKVENFVIECGLGDVGMFYWENPTETLHETYQMDFVNVTDYEWDYHRNYYKFVLNIDLSKVLYDVDLSIYGSDTTLTDSIKFIRNAHKEFVDKTKSVINLKDFQIDYSWQVGTVEEIIADMFSHCTLVKHFYSVDVSYNFTDLRDYLDDIGSSNIYDDFECACESFYSQIHDYIKGLVKSDYEYRDYLGNGFIEEMNEGYVYFINDEETNVEEIYEIMEYDSLKREYNNIQENIIKYITDKMLSVMTKVEKRIDLVKTLVEAEEKDIKEE